MHKNAIPGTIHSRNFEETRKLGVRIGKTLLRGDLLFVRGEMGAGKTHLIQGIARGLGITALVNSPTYVYIHPYPLPEGAFYHVDLYRIQEVEKLKMIGMEELLFDPTNILAIEWPEILAAAYPNLPDRNILHIHILKHEKDQRTILIGKKRDA